MRTHFLIRLSWVPLPDAVAKEAGIQITSTKEFEGRNTMQNHSKNELHSLVTGMGLGVCRFLS